MRKLALVLSVLIPAVALAQEGAAPIEDRPMAKVSEVEHGIFFGVEAGGVFLFSPKSSPNAAGASTGGFSPGRSFAITIGGEIKDFLSLGVLVMGNTISTPSGFIAEPRTDSVSPGTGNFSALTLGAIVKVSPIGFTDSNSVKRLYLCVRLGGGYSLISPKDFYSGGDITILGGVGLEYFTHLRHFSLGLSADFVYGVQHMGPGFAITPNLRYTF